MKVIWSAAAVRHLQAAFGSREGESSGTANPLRRRILDAVRRVGQSPASGRTGRMMNSREAAVPRTPYTVVYQIAAQSIEILAILHARPSGD